MNFLELTNDVRFTLGLEDISVNDEVALAKKWVNRGVVDIVQRTRPSTRVLSLVLTGGVKVHDMSDQIISLLDLQAPGDGEFLTRLTREDIVRAQRAGQPAFAYEEPLLWISPVPSEETTFQAYGCFTPDEMVGDTDSPSQLQFGGLHVGFHPAIVNYACWKAGEYVQHEQSGGGERWRTLYEGQDGTGGDIAMIKRILAKRVTPQGQRRRDLTGNLGSLSASGSYIGS